MSDFDKRLNLQIKELGREISCMENSLSGAQSDSSRTEALEFINTKKSQLHKLQELQRNLKNIESQFGNSRNRPKKRLKFRARLHAWLGSVGLAVILFYKLIEVNYGVAVAEGVMQALVIFTCFVVAMFFIRQFGGKR